jgi:glycosyltransferase involved in cell wall biosynthesis
MLVTLKKDPTFERTIPAKVQSYMACGKPMVAGLDGEGARIVDLAGAGVTCPSEDPCALAEAILKMYRFSTTQREAMGTSGLRYFKLHFERKRLLNRLVDLINETTRGRLKCGF